MFLMGPIIPMCRMFRMSLSRDRTGSEPYRLSQDIGGTPGFGQFPSLGVLSRSIPRLSVGRHFAGRALFDGFGRLSELFQGAFGYRAEIEVRVRVGDLPERRQQAETELG